MANKLKHTSEALFQTMNDHGQIMLDNAIATSGDLEAYIEDKDIEVILDAYGQKLYLTIILSDTDGNNKTIKVNFDAFNETYENLANNILDKI